MPQNGHALPSMEYGPLQMGKLSPNSLNSAAVIVPLVLEYVSATRVVDFGCKHGEWLSIFRKQGVAKVFGIDQQKRATNVIIEPLEFLVADLNQPVTLQEKFDLAVCVEVAEHLQETSAAPLVATLTSAAPVVLFSAALPGQGGHGHYNEQPRAYWHDLFDRHGFTPIDCVRPHIWQDKRVAFWYRQNLMLYASAAGAAQHPRLASEAGKDRATDLELVHLDVLQRLSPAHRLREIVSKAVHTLRGANR